MQTAISERIVRQSERVVLYNQPYWETHCKFFSDYLACLWGEIFGTADILLKITLLRHSIPNEIKRLLKETEPHTEAFFPLSSLQEHVAQFNTYFLPIQSNRFPESSWLNCTTEIFVNNDDDLIKPEELLPMKLWVCNKSSRFVRWVYNNDSEADSASSAKDKAEISDHNDAIVSLQLETASTYSANQPIQHKKLVVTGKGEMYLLDDNINTIHVTGGMPMKYVGTIAINHKGQLQEIKAQDEDYPVTNEHTKEILEYLNSLGLDTTHTKIIEIIPSPHHEEVKQRLAHLLDFLTPNFAPSTPIGFEASSPILASPFLPNENLTSVQGTLDDTLDPASSSSSEGKDQRLNK